MDRRLIPFGAVCVCGGWLQIGCIIPEPPDLENAPGISVLGACMCSECWTQPFCVNNDELTVVIDDEGAVVVPNSGGSCPRIFS